MRISELSRRCGVSTGTIKFYLREGLLPAGELTARTQARYDDAHVERLLLIRALLGPGRLTVAAARRVLAALDRRDADWPEPVRLTQDALSRPAVDGAADLAPALHLMCLLGWDSATDCAHVRDLAEALQGALNAGLVLTEEELVSSARWASTLAAHDLAAVAATEEGDASEQAVLRVILIEPIMISLRRLALRHASRSTGESERRPARDRNRPEWNSRELGMNSDSDPQVGY